MWILHNGAWDDTGVWDDTDVWKDAPSDASGVLAATEAIDVAALAGSFAAIPSGVLVATEARDVCAMSGIVVSFATGGLAAVERPDAAQLFGGFKDRRQLAKVPYPSIWDYGWYDRQPPIRR
jgi:hypothetical protein